MNAVWMILVEGLAIAAAGTLLHFVYDWSRHSKYVGLVAAVNESTWEHIKIALIPMLAAMCVDGLWWGQEPNYFVGKLFSMLTVIVLIPVLFYGYKALAKHDILWLDISIFMIAIWLGQAAFYAMTQVADWGAALNFVALDGILALLAATMAMTCLPVRNFIFKDPITRRYGFRGHKLENDKM